MSAKWDVGQARRWHQAEKFHQGVNYLPSNAVNQIDMWQNLDLDVIHKELGWAANLGYTAVRVFLHDLIFTTEGEDVMHQKIEMFLSVAAQHNLKTVLVLFEGVFDPQPYYDPVGRLRGGTGNGDRRFLIDGDTDVNGIDGLDSNNETSSNTTIEGSGEGAMPGDSQVFDDPGTGTEPTTNTSDTTGGIIPPEGGGIPPTGDNDGVSNTTDGSQQEPIAPDVPATNSTGGGEQSPVTPAVPEYKPAQLPPRPNVHNSRWVQSPGRQILEEEKHEETLKPYVQSIVKKYGNDDGRVLMIDLFDQPENGNEFTYGKEGTRVAATQDAFDTEMDGIKKAEIMRVLIPMIVEWAHAVGKRSVPLTIPAWHDENNLAHHGGSVSETNNITGGESSSLAYAKHQNWLRDEYLTGSDVISFHNYENITILKAVIERIEKRHPDRPIICTSYMSRDTGSTFDPILGELHRRRIWAFNWGFVAGFSQTVYPANSWQQEYSGIPTLWHHDVLWPNGTAYLESERQYLQSYQDIHQRVHGTTSVTSTQPSVAVPVTMFLVTFAVVVGVMVFLNRRMRQRARFAPVQHAEREAAGKSDLELTSFT